MNLPGAEFLPAPASAPAGACPAVRHGAAPAGARARAIAAIVLLTLAGNGAAAGASANASANTSAATAPSARAVEDAVTLNFVNADLEAVVRAIGQFTGRTFVIDPRVKGTLTLVTERPVTRRQAYEELLSALRLQGFTLVESPEAGGMSRVVLEADAKLQGGRVLAPDSAPSRGDQVVTQVFRLQYESASNLVPVLRPLIAPNNTIAAYAANNTLVITDYADNLRRIARIIEAVDSPAGSDLAVIPLHYGLAADLAALVSRVLDESARTSGQAVDAGQRVTVLADARSNTLILRAASRARLEQARSLVEHFDQPSATPGAINVVYLRNAQATRLAPLLRAVLSSDGSYLPQASSGSSFSGAGATGAGLGGGLGGGGAGSSAFTGLGSGSGTTPGSAQAPSLAGGASQSPAGSAGGGGNDRSGLSGMIQADPATNSLIISAPEPLYRNIRAIIDRLDVRPAQVLIESLVVEITGERASDIGVQWQTLGGLNDTNGSTTHVVGGTNFGGAGTNILGVAQNLGSLGSGLNIGVIKGQVSIPGISGAVTNIGALASALSSVTKANIVSRPNIMTLDNEEGRFLVGQNVPFVTGSYAATGNTSGSSAVNPFQTFERHDVGLQLRIRPQVSEGGSVRMAIYIEDSSVSGGTSGSGLVLNKRSFESNVVVADGNFAVISGMIQDQANESVSKVPLLGDIPLLGSLFRYETRDHTKTQTMVFLRPIVLRDEERATSLARERYDYIRNELGDAASDAGSLLGAGGVAPLPALPPATPATTPAAPAPAPAPAAAPGASPQRP
jgi:general secretion pathway protein D